jgi:hypothetical protein
MRKFKDMNQEEKIWLKLHITAKQASVLQNEAKKIGLTMSGYVALKLQEFIDKQEKEG